jgi:hypothetical protein
MVEQKVAVGQTKTFDGKTYTLDTIVKRATTGPKYLDVAKNRVKELHNLGYFARYCVQNSGRRSTALIYSRRRGK